MILTSCPTLILPDRWAHAFVERRLEAGEIAGRWEIIDLEGDLRYPNEGLGSIRRTCLAAAAVLPVYGLAYMVWHTVRAPFSAVSIFFHTVEEMLARPSLSVLFNLVRLPLWHLAESLWMVVRTPLRVLAMQSSALYGLIKPLEGRQLSHAAERHLRGGAAPFALDFHSGYLFKSFQPYGAVKDPSVVSVQFALERDSLG